MKQRIILGMLWGWCFLALLTACGSVSSSSHRQQGFQEQVDPLTPELRRKYDYFFLEALRLKERGDLDAAFELYSHCLDLYPKGAATLFEISRFRMFLEKPEKGELALKEAVEADPKNFWYKQTLAAYYQNKREFEQAIQVYEDMAAQFPKRLEPLLALIDLYARTQDYAQEIHTLNRLENLDGKSEEISMEKFRAYLAMEDDEKAFQEIEALAKEYAYDMRYQTILGDVYLNNDRDEEALATYQRILKEEPAYAPARLSLASYYEKMGEDSLYQVQLDQLLLNETVDSETKLNILRQLILRSEQGDRDSTKLQAIFTSVLHEKQENADVAMLAAQYYLTKKMDKEAQPVLHQVLDLDPENTPARLQLLSFAISKDNMEEVIRICAPALEYTPDVLEFYYYKGLAHHQLDQTDEALQTFSRGVRCIDEKTDKTLASDFFAILGDLYHIKNMNAKAYEAYDSALVYKDDNIGALNNYAYYLSLERQQLDKAEEMSYRTVKADPDNGTYLDTYAWILFEKGKFVEAKIYIDQALQTEDSGKSSVVVEHAGDIHFMNGEKERAVELWKQALELAKQQPEEGSEPRSEKALKLLRKKIEQQKYFAK